MQDQIVAIAKRTGMRISGPNAEGFLSEVQKVAATFSPTVDVKPGHVPLVATKRRIAIVAQSGGIGFAIKHRAKALGVAISYCVRPAMKAISAPASSSITWCRTPPPT